MSEEQFNEAKQLIQDGMKLREAARKVGVSHTTLLRRISKEAAQRLANKLTPESGSDLQTDSELEPEPWRTIRRQENQNRKQGGLPPLTDDEWAAKKVESEKAQKSMEQLLGDSWQQWTTWKPNQ